MGTGKDCADHRVNLITAPCALISRVAFNAMELPVLMALRAIKGFAVVLAHQEVKARIVIGELLENC